MWKQVYVQSPFPADRPCASGRPTDTTLSDPYRSIVPVNVDESRIRDCCTDAVFERGRSYHEEGRITRVGRFGSVVTATVQGSRPYDATVDVSAPAFDATCTCPYTGPGECKHVVAVLLAVADDPPTDERDRVETALGDASPGALRSFALDELARDPGMRDRFLAQFGDPPGRAVAAYRAEVDRLFDEHAADDPVVVAAIDFSRVTDLAERYREQGHYREAATVYRALAEGIERNLDRVDAAYDHYLGTFRAALDWYVECVRAADVSEDERRRYVEALSERAADATDYLAAEYAVALEALRTDR